ncbi:predicted protein [Plenodomus lingam JN3]|uniref:Uncharacterized protein n=1 Tax=Leptosphaeria maculans (strain JN3 / isolate v23.1.3 / race Av1-4-5-6-7-8) TaxID=985895 RepID=E5A5W8_LEPMJ|nr:predicted protein [Plenodomus lingam JN3]CBX99013.1 predicted protein [Plenodomus lingam JN3]
MPVEVAVPNFLPELQRTRAWLQRERRRNGPHSASDCRTVGGGGGDHGRNDTRRPTMTRLQSGSGSLECMPWLCLVALFKPDGDLLTCSTSLVLARNRIGYTSLPGMYKTNARDALFLVDVHGTPHP